MKSSFREWYLHALDDKKTHSNIGELTSSEISN